VGTPCAFTADPSSDNVGITGYGWDFNGDLTNDFTTEDASFTFGTEGDFPVRLIVSDAAGLADTAINNVSVGAPANTAPTAGFTFTCTGGNCTFTNTSADTDGTIASYAWDFGDPASGTANTSTLEDPTHTYAVPATTTPYTVTLTVIDDDGAEAEATQTVTISPPATLECLDGSSCTIEVTDRAVLTATMTARACQFDGNKLELIAPIMQVLFTNGCAEPVGAVYQLNQGNPFEAGTQIQARFTQGTPTTPPPTPPVAPQIRVEGTYPDWTLSIDDGGAGPNEPDFNDIVVTVHAQAAP
jgi:hypothetical protein